MIDNSALNKISYGLYIVSSHKEDKINAMIVNSLIQVTAEPAQILVSVNKESLTYEYIMASGVFAAMPVTQHATMPFIGNFGFRTGRNFNKFEKITYELGETGSPIVRENTSAVYEVVVSQKVDVGSHMLFVGEVKRAEKFCEDVCLTYDYYRDVIKGKVPKGATHI
ncbi:ferric-chelate reductase [NAD(P)H] [Elusimicrobium posterum]|uniref:flavin reductase family protein n=1 Tax=Elusimicrobium posterum TaxID=3116653 RepID=UPI003C75BF4A